MPFACIFVPDFAVEAVLRAEPELRSQAVVVLEGKPPLQKVFALNENARAAGIEIGMTKLQVEAGSGLALRNRSALQESAAHAALLDCAQSFSPRVEDTASDTVVLDISGMELVFGPVAKLARDLARRTSDLGLECNVAVASNPDAATLAARGFAGVTVIASGAEEERLGNLPLEVLWDGKPQQNPAQAGIIDTLERWGVRNLRAFIALPEIAISERLGQDGLRLQKLARGAASRTLVPVDLPLIFEEAAELEYPLVLLEPLAFLLGRLLEQLCARLAARTLATQELRLKMELDTSDHSEEMESACRVEEDGVSAATGTDTLRTAPDASPGSKRASWFTRTIRLPLPMLDARVFLKLLQLDLKAHPPGAPIVKIWLSAEPSRPRAAQGGLFRPPSPEPEKLELTLARISGIVGEGKVGSLEILDTHCPDPFRMQRFTVSPQSQNSLRKNSRVNSNREGHNCNRERQDCNQGGRNSNREGHDFQSCRKSCELNGSFSRWGEQSLKVNGSCATDSQHNGAVTALRMFRPPLQAAVTLRDGRPARIECAKKKDVRGEVIWQAGPWRSSGDWWERSAWARDEWDIAVQAEAGVVLYRLVHDLLSGKWMLEGTYD